MAIHKAELFTVAELATLLSAGARARTTGSIVWSYKKPRCLIGVLPVRTELDAISASALQIYITEPAPSSPSMQYMVRGVPVRRCDVNGSHRKVKFTTHKHTYDPASGAEGFYVPDDIPTIPHGTTVARGAHRSVFAAFAAECHIALQDGYWVDPPS